MKKVVLMFAFFGILSVSSLYAGYGVFSCIDLNGGPGSPTKYGCWVGTGCVAQFVCGDATSEGQRNSTISSQ